MFNVGLGELLTILGVFVVFPTVALIIYSLGRRAGERDERQRRGRR